jgi:hypothetical protein
VGSIPTVARHIFQACPVWIFTQSNITSISVINVIKGSWSRGVERRGRTLHATLGKIPENR